MTPTDPTADAPDELAVHAVLDGQATPDQRRRVARDPGLRARLAEMRTAAEAIAEHPPPPTPDELTRIRSRALASLDETAEDEADPAGEGLGASDPEPGPTPVTSLPTRRRRRQLPPLPAVAAVVLVLLVVGVALIATGGGNADQSADAGATTSAEATVGPEAGADPGSADAAPEDEAGRAEAPTAVDRDLGPPGATYPDEEALRTALEQLEDPLTLRSLRSPAEADAAARETAAQETAAARCGEVLRATDPALDPVQASAVVVVDDATLLVVSTPRAATRDAPATTRLFAVDPISCVPILGVDR